MDSTNALLTRLDAFLAALPTGVPYAIEIRNPELLTPNYRDILAAHAASHAFVVHPSMPMPREQRAIVGDDSPTTIIRWMLRRDMTYTGARSRFAPFDSLAAPDPEALEDITDIVLSAVERMVNAMVIINNKAEGSSPISVARLAQRVVDNLS